MTFLGDEGRDVLVVKRMIVDNKMTLLGPTASVGGFFLGPIYYYFMIPFLWLFQLNPVGPAVMVAIFGIATIYLIYYLGCLIKGASSGLVGAMLYALSPVVINYSHSSWNPNIVPFFSLLLIILLLKLSKGIDRIKLLLIGAIFGIGLQLHYLFLFLMVFTGIFLLVNHKEKVFKKILYIFLGFVILYSPFILFELRHNFPNFRMIIKYVFSSDDTGFSLSYFLFNLKDVFYRLFYRLVANNNHLLAVASIPMAIYAYFKLQMSGEKKKLSLLILWGLVPIFLFGFYKKAIYDYYLGILFPLPFLLIGLGFGFLKNIFLKMVVFIFIMYLGLYNWNARPFIYTPNQQLKQVRDAAELVLDKAGGKPFNFGLITDHNSDHAYRYFFEISGNKAVQVENTILDPQRKTVTKQLFVICETSNCSPLGHPSWDIAGYGRAEIIDKWKSSVLTIYKLVPYF